MNYNKKQLVSIEVMMEPLAIKALEREGKKDKRGIDITRSWIYPVVRLALRKENRIPGAVVAKEVVGAKKINIYITMSDFIRYGACIPIQNQAAISRFLYKYERDRICKEVRWAHVIGMAPRDRTIKHILYEMGIEEDEKTFQSIKKYYQRHYSQTENGFQADYVAITNR